MSGLSTEQKIDALYEKFVINVPEPAPVAGAPISFHRPTAAQLAAFCVDFKLVPDQLIPWTQTPRGDTVKAHANSFPVLPATTDPVVAKRYAGFGYAATGVQMLQTEIGFKQSRELADRVIKANTPEELDFLEGAKYADTEAVVYGCMSNTGVKFAGLGGSPTFGGGLTIADLIIVQYKASTRKPGDPGAGIAGV